MSLWNRLFGKKPPSDSASGAGPRPALSPTNEKDEPHLIEIVFVFDELPDNLAPWHEVQKEMDDALHAADAGEVDGDLWGGGQCVVYCYGPDAERMWEVLAPIIEPHPIPRGSYALKHFRGPGPHRTERVNLHWDG